MGRYTGKKCRLISMFFLTSIFFLVEIVVGHVTNSMALVADAFHMLSDIAALIIAFVSVRMSPKSWSKNTYGWARAEVLGALVNAVFLVALCFSITMESLKRFYDPEKIENPVMILYVGALGLIVNLLGLCLFHEHGAGHGHSHGGGGGHGHSHGGPSKSHHPRSGAHSHLAALADVDEEADDCYKQVHYAESLGPNSGKDINNENLGKVNASQMNMRGVFLHVMADALGSVVVIISAIIIWQTDWEYKYYVDPGLSLIMVVLMMKSVWPLLIESALILLQTVPTHLDVDTLKKKLLDNVDGILAVHEFHVWQLTGERIIASAHISCHNLSEYMKVAENIKEFFHNEGIHSTTIQPEFLDYEQNAINQIINDDCALSCPKGTSQDNSACEASKCCPPLNGKEGSRSTTNTPTIGRRANSFVMDKDQRMTNSQSFSTRRNKTVCGSTPRSHNQRDSCRDQQDIPMPQIYRQQTSTPNRRSAPNLPSMVAIDLEQSQIEDYLADELTAEIDLSDPKYASRPDDLGVAPLSDQNEGTPMMCTPRSNSRVVRIISKQSNV